MKKYLYLFSGLLIFPLAAAEYYVSPAGKDTNPGSKKAPFRTIAFAARKVKAGDTVNIMPGIYRENPRFTLRGTKNAPITFKGSRNKKGEYLSIIEAPGENLPRWQKAPEIAPGVWKTPVSKRPDCILVDGRMVLYINFKTMALPRDSKKRTIIKGADLSSRFGKNCKRIPGLDLLAMDKNIKMTGGQLKKRKEPFWSTIGNILAGWKDGYLYIRFANSSDPSKHVISAHRGVGFTLTGARYLNFKDLHLRSSLNQFAVTAGSSHITIDGCLLMNGQKRVFIDKSSSDVIIKNSILTSGFIQPGHYGSHSPQDRRGRVIYLLFKFIAGFSLSADVGVTTYGTNTTICHNVITDGLIGMQAWGPGMKVYNNVITQMASCGIVTGACTVGEFHHNLISYCGILLRFHNMREKHAKRLEYHYSNLFLQHRFSGTELFVFCGSHLRGDDMINFEPGTAIYKKNPPKPVYPGDFFIYHNTLWGGNRISAPFDCSKTAKRFREPYPFCLVNNIMRYGASFNTWQHVFDNNLFYAFTSQAFRGKGDPDIAKRNKILSVEESKKIWNSKKYPGVPDITLRSDSHALNVGVDVSKPFSYRGRHYAALPGFKPGYFKGKAPAAGALQPHENMDHFVKLARKLADARKFID